MRNRKKWVNLIAVLSLLVAFVFGKYHSDQGFDEQISNIFPDVELNKLPDAEQIYALGNTGGFLSTASSNGYGGPLIVGVEIRNDSLRKVHLLKERETYSFIIKLINEKFFKQFEGMRFSDSFSVPEEVEVVSGATVSSMAFANAIRQASHSLAAQTSDFKPEPVSKIWHFSWHEGFLILLILLAGFSVFMKKRSWRYLSMFISFVFLGFILNASLSLSHFSSLLLGYFPTIHDHLLWWILMLSSIGAALFMGKNIYCSGLCPFHAAQIFLSKIGGINLLFPRKIQKIIKHTSKILLWLALMLTFLADNPTVGSYEPFALLFSLQGSGFHWYLLPAVLVGSLLVPDVFCRYFCPVGRSFNYMIKARKTVKDKLWPSKKGDNSI